jgi:5-methyltetrahydropteroyltriglutamate--homocysteine methyltransferase
MTSMNALVDDVGSFPLPAQVSREVFDRAYVQARRAISAKEDIRKDAFLAEYFYKVVVESFRKKCATGLDVVNYPQHYDMYKQVTDSVSDAMDRGTYLVDEKDAVIPEVHVINEKARELCAEFGKRISLRVCVTGPLEAYLRMMGFVGYKDILMMFAETVKRFAERAILDSKYVKTEVVCLDEPSLGFQEVSAGRDIIMDVLERAFNFSGVTRQIHLHSSTKAIDLLEVENLDVLALEFAASPRNLEGLSRRMLDEVDKCVRVGISRTDVDSISAELYEKGVTQPAVEQLVEAEDTMRRRFILARKKYGDRMLFAGPDCGLGGWPTQESAELLLRRTVNAVKHVQITSSVE